MTSTPESVHELLQDEGLLFERSITPMVVVNSDRIMVKTNRRFQELFGYSAEELHGRTTALLTPSPEHFQAYRRFFQRTSEGSLESSELQYRKKNGDLFWVKLTGTLLTAGGGRFILWAFDDITREVESREEIRERYRELQVIFEKVRTGLVFIVDGVIERVNDAFLAMADAPLDAMRLRPVKDFPEIFGDLSETPKREIRFHKSDGQTIIAERELVPISSSGHLAVFVDLTAHMREKEYFRRKSQLDGMTGIFNHSTFIGRAQEKLANHKGESISLLLFDVDHFKSINDRFGHSVGDEVLVELTGLVKGQLRRDEIFGRLGGEEFAILLQAPLGDAATVGARVMQCIRSQEFTTRKLALTVSMGLADTTTAASFEELYDVTDRLLYAAKRNGRNRLESSVGSLA